MAQKKTDITERLALSSAAIKLDDNGELPTRIALFIAGEWPNSVKGNFSISVDDLREIKEHFDAGIGFPTADASTGLAIDFKHEYADQAAAWIKGMELVDEGDGKATLYADPVEWTDVGAEAVKGGRFKCISPMGYFGRRDGKQSMWSSHTNLKEKLPNVMDGAGLTNIPFLHGMPPIRADRQDEEDVNNNKSNKENYMNLDALRVKDVKDLNGEEYKFLADNKADLTDDEREKFSLEVAEPKETLSAEDKATLDAIKSGDKKVVDAKELSDEKEELARLAKSVAKFEEKEVSDMLDAHIKRGAIKSDQKEFWSKQVLAAADEGARKGLEDALAALPSNEELSKEIGASNTPDVDAVTALDNEVQAKMKADKINYKEALAAVKAEKPELFEQYQAAQEGEK